MPAPSPFHYEVEVSEVDAPEAPGASLSQMTTVRCHGSLMSGTSGQIEQIFKQTPFQGQIVLDLGDVNYVDSSGLGALIRLKLSAAKNEGVDVRYVNISPGLLTLLRISNLEDWFTS